MTPRNYNIKKIKEFRKKFLYDFPYLNIKYVIEGYHHPGHIIRIEPLKLYKNNKASAFMDEWEEEFKRLFPEEYPYLVLIDSDSLKVKEEFVVFEVKFPV